MRKDMKRLIALLLGVLMALPCLAACGGKPTASQTDGTKKLKVTLVLPD